MQSNERKGVDDIMLNVQIKKVWSATFSYFIYGVLCLILFIICIVAVVSKQGYGLLPIVMIPEFGLLLLAYISINNYHNRKQFEIYVTKIDRHTNMEFIRECYSIQDMNPNYVLFVKPKDTKNFSSWKMFKMHWDLNTFVEKEYNF